MTGTCTICGVTTPEGRKETEARTRCDAHAKTKRAPGGRYFKRGGYVDVWIEDQQGFVTEHRHVMEQSLGRELVKGENIHHLNGITGDNRIENLELWYTSQPRGQRVEDLIRYLVEQHSDELLHELETR